MLNNKRLTSLDVRNNPGYAEGSNFKSSFFFVCLFSIFIEQEKQWRKSKRLFTATNTKSKHCNIKYAYHVPNESSFFKTKR